MYFNYEPNFNGIFSRDNFPRITDGAYVINRSAKQSKGTQWVLLFIDRNTVVYFDSFSFENISQEVLSKIKEKYITHNISRIQDYVSIMCGFIVSLL